jgi:aminoglycoside phosphotransferase family enzyme/predicted kinase
MMAFAMPELIDALRRQLGATLVETHISWVLLDGEHAWKIKKPLRLPFVDFSELETRRRMCEEELRLNRRLAPSLYLDVVAIRGTPAAPRLDGDGGLAIEYALRMRQFAAGALLSERLAAGTLLPAQLDRLAQRLAAFHRAAEVAASQSPYGTPRLIEDAALQVIDGLAQRGCAQACAALREWLLVLGPRLHGTWLRRKSEGRIREGHGDLHLANAVVLGNEDSEVTAFDCLEFDPALRWIDVQSDIAFLAMDLLAHERGDLAFRFLNAYLDDSGDHAGLPVLRYYLVYRALVRALVARIRAEQEQAARGADYLALAQRLCKAGDARLLITHGVSGSGKSFATQRLLERAQAIRLRSDVERKRLFGLRALDDSARRGGDIYGSEATRRTYARLRALAAIALASGHRVIVDAVFLRADEREDFRRLAHAQGVPFTILHCHAPPDTLRERVRARRERGDDASEADLSVLERQLSLLQPLQTAEQACAITLDSAVPLDSEAIAQRWVGVAR